MRAAVGQAVHRVVGMLQILEEIEVAVAVVEDREIDEALAIVLHQQVVGIFARRNPRRGGARHDAFVHFRLVIEIGVHFELHRPAERDDFQEVDDVAFRPDIFLGDHPRLERRVFQLRELRLPRQVDDLVPRRLEAEGVHRPLPRHDDAIAAQRDLRDDIRAGRVLAPHFRNLFLERQFLGDRLERGEGHRQPGFAAEVAHPLKLVPLALEIARHFEHAIADAPHRAADRDQLLGGRGGAGDEFAVDRFVEHGAAGRETERAGADAFLDDPRHFGDVGIGRDRAGLLTVAEHIGAHRAVRDVAGDIDGARQFLQRVHIFGEGFPVPAHPFGERGAGDVLNAFHQADQPFVAVGFGGGKANAAIAHDDGGDAVPARRRHFLVPCRLPVIMGVDVDEAGGDDLAAGVEFVAPYTEIFADRDDAITVNRDIRDKGRSAHTIDDGAAAYHQIKHPESPDLFSFTKKPIIKIARCK